MGKTFNFFGLVIKIFKYFFEVIKILDLIFNWIIILNERNKIEIYFGLVDVDCLSIANKLMCI